MVSADSGHNLNGLGLMRPTRRCHPPRHPGNGEAFVMTVTSRSRFFNSKSIPTNGFSPPRQNRFFINAFLQRVPNPFMPSESGIKITLR